MRPAEREGGSAIASNDTRPPFRPEALESRRHPETSGSPLETPSRRRLRSVVVAVLRAVAAVGTSAFRGRGRRALRFVPQVEAADCGAACLVTVLDYYGIQAALGDVRRRLDSGRGGVSALSLVRVARSYGLSARGVRTEPQGVAQLPRGTILHWNLDHFVVLDKPLGRHDVQVVDPAFGYRFLPLRMLDRGFSGIALVFDGPRGEVADTARRASETGRARPWSRVLPLLREPRLLRLIAIAGITSQALVLSFPFVLRYVLDEIVPNGEVSAARRLGLLVVPILLAQMFVLGVRAVSLSWLRARVDYRLSLAILNKMMSLPYAYLLRRSTGDLLLRVRSTTALRQVFSTAILSGVVDGMTALSLFGVVLYLDARLALVGLAVVVVQTLVLAAAWRGQWQLTAAGLESQATSQGRLVELLTGIETIKIAGAENDAADVWAQLVADETNWEIRRSISGGVTDALIQALRLVAPVVLLVVGTLEVLDGRTATGSMIAATSLAVAALTPFTSMLATAFQLTVVRAYLERINDVFDEESEPQGDYAPATARGALRAEGVTFTYTGAAAPVLDGLDLDVEPGEFVAIAGPSGSGKSTLAMVLSGLHRPESGRILLDDVDAAEYTLASRRALLGFVPQDPHFFGATIRDNITLFRDYPTDEVEQAVEHAYLTDEIARLPAGLETMLVEGGKSLSGGQLQRLGLARAMIAKPRALILDEATSALDPDAEREVLDRVRRLGITTIVITHRESVAARADRALTVVEGKLRPYAGTAARE